jgi:hypothetical protein
MRYIFYVAACIFDRSRDIEPATLKNNDSMHTSS